MSYLRVLHRYLNIDLRDQLNFREHYNYPILNDNKNIIYFNRDSTPYSELESKLLSDINLVMVMKKTIRNFLLQEIEERNITEIKILIDHKPYRRGIGIILVQDPVEIIDINIYVEIISHFDDIEEINNYRMVNKNIVNICKKKELWRGLVKKVYPFKYKNEYNYEKLYKQYLEYKTYKIDKDTGLPFLCKSDNNLVSIQYAYLGQMTEIVKFLILEGIIVPKYYKYYLLDILLIISKYDIVDLQKIIYVCGTNFDVEKFSEVISHIIGENHVGGIKIFLELDFGSQYGLDQKFHDIVECFDYIWNYRNEKISDQMKDSIIKALPSNLSKSFEDSLEVIYDYSDDESVDEDDGNETDDG